MGQSVLITGGASGLGLAIAQRFVEEGANVAVLDRSPAAPEILRAQLGDEVVCAVGDVRKLRDNQRAVQACVRPRGGSTASVYRNEYSAPEPGSGRKSVVLNTRRVLGDEVDERAEGDAARRPRG